MNQGGEHMWGIRRWGTAVVGALLTAGACVPGGPPPPEPSDEIEVTPITTPDGGGALGKQPMINEHGEITFTPDGTSDAVLLKDGELTRINPEGTSAEPSGITDEGQVVGSTGPSVGEMTSPFSWESGRWEMLPIGEAVSGGALDANDRGTVAGSLLPGFLLRAEPVVWDDGEIVRPPEELSLVPGLPLSPPGINNRNQYAFNVLTDGPGGAAIWDVDGGEVTHLGTLGGGSSLVTAINDRGMATGLSTNDDDIVRAFLWHDGEMTDLGTLGGDLSFGLSLNEWGQVTGISEDADGRFHGFLWHDGKMTQIDGLGGTGDSGIAVGAISSYPLAINNWGQVVGTSDTPEGGSQAFLWQNGRTVNLGELADPDLESRAVEINDRGQIPGYTREPSSGASPGYLWTVSPLWGYPDGL